MRNENLNVNSNNAAPANEASELIDQAVRIFAKAILLAMTATTVIEPVMATPVVAPASMATPLRRPDPDRAEEVVLKAIEAMTGPSNYWINIRNIPFHVSKEMRSAEARAMALYLAGKGVVEHERRIAGGKLHDYVRRVAPREA